MLFHISLCLLVHREDAVLSAGLDGHIGNRKAVVHGQIRHALSRKLHGFIEGSVHADHADDVQDHVFSTDPLGGFAHQVEPDRGRNLEPGLARRHAGRHVRTAHARGEGAQRPVGTGVGVRSDDAVPGHCQAFFREQGVLDSHLSHVKIIGDLLAAGKFPHTLAVLRRLDIFVGDKMIHHQGNLILIKDLLLFQLSHLADGHRGGDIPEPDPAAPR